VRCPYQAWHGAIWVSILAVVPAANKCPFPLSTRTPRRSARHSKQQLLDAYRQVKARLSVAVSVSARLNSRIFSSRSGFSSPASRPTHMAHPGLRRKHRMSANDPKTRHSDIARGVDNRVGRAATATQSRAIPSWLSPERWILRADVTRRASRSAEGRTVPKRLDAEWGLLRGDEARALTPGPFSRAHRTPAPCSAAPS
jgi:hypothetical protein